MYTKARIGGHPIHPMLVAFPIALYAVTFVTVLVHLATTEPFWYHVATYASIAAVVMAAVAALPGLIDLLAIPDHSRARATGLKHAGFNVLALALFTVSAIVLARNWFGVTPWNELDDTWPLLLSLAGLACTGVAGYFGWTLVQTHHVGVRPTTHATVAPRADEVDDLDELIAPNTPIATVRTHDVLLRH